MLLIEHRVNTVEHLRRTPTEYGVEVDIRDYDGTLRMQHDPLLGGEPLEDLLREYKHALIIFNVKCDGLESKILELAHKYGIKSYFFLDSATPTFVNLARKGERNLGVRFSEFEPIEFALAFAGKVEWCWIDCFTKLPLDPDNYQILKKHFKLCLVSPELQKHPREAIQEYKKLLRDMPVDAVCTDFCDDWK